MKIILLLVGLLVMDLHADQIIKGNNILKQEEKSVSEYESINVSGMFNVNIIESQEKGNIKVSGDSNLLKYIKVEVENKNLTITSTKSFETKNDITINIKTKQTNKIILNGTINLNIKAIQNKEFSLKSLGCNNIILNGKVESLLLDLQGTVELNALELLSEQVSINAKGNSEIAVNSQKKLDVKLDGICDLKYKGNPKITKQVDGILDIVEISE